ncbi:MAG: ABC transporter ATP-binding protein, partial [Sphingomonas sp.]
MILAARKEVGASVPASADPVLKVEGLSVVVRTEAGIKPLVEDLSFTLSRGETLCIAGESGSGKSMTALAIMGLLPKPAVSIGAGAIRLGALDLAGMDERQLRRVRGDRVAMIFQEPMTSLNPVLTIGRQLTEAIRAHRPVSAAEARRKAIAALEAVRIPDAAGRLAQH